MREVLRRSGKKTYIQVICDICGNERWKRKDTPPAPCLTCSNSSRVGANNVKWKGCGVISGAKVTQIKRTAVCRGIAFYVTAEDLNAQWVKQNGLCFYTGLPLVIDRLFRAEKNTASLDRLDSSGPYEVNNIVWVHKRINIMKNKFDSAEFVYFCKLVAAYSELNPYAAV